MGKYKMVFDEMKRGRFQYSEH